MRPGSDIGEDAHVGNFVETKKTRLGKGSKANHLTYLGDAEIGEGVNVGAGTITCNYDGVNKSHTVIEDGAFIGSDTTWRPVGIARVHRALQRPEDVRNALAISRGAGPEYSSSPLSTKTRFRSGSTDAPSLWDAGRQPYTNRGSAGKRRGR